MNTPIAFSAFSKASRRAPCRPKTLVLLTLAAACLPIADAAAQGPSAVPDSAGQVMLIRNTLTAVNHGNITGNYTVLRDLGSERFRRRNTAGDLASTFANLRKQTRDLSPILVTDPQLTQQAAQDQYGRMQLVGFFPTRPKAVRFGLVFQKIAGAWVIDEITVVVVPIESVVPTQHSPPSPPLRQPLDTAAWPNARLGSPYQASPFGNRWLE